MRHQSSIALIAAASLAWATIFSVTSAVHAQDAESQEAPALAPHEQTFADLLTGAEMVGYFTMDGRETEQPLREDRYEIVKITKIKDHQWKVESKIGYGGKDMVIPLMVDVHWADDTPVLGVTKLAVPGMGVYSARILFYGDQYAGTWSGGTFGGKMFGRVVRDDGDDAQSNGEAETDKEAQVANWPQFRGPQARGVSDGPAPPTEWDVATGRNILWKTAIGGLAHSSPIIWGDCLYVTSAERVDGDSSLKVGLYGAGDPVDDEGIHRFTVACLNRHTGDVIWKRIAYEGAPEVKRHPKATHANSTPVTNGEHVVAFFGSEGLYCYDMDGELIWSRDFGVLNAGAPGMPSYEWGFASSPIIHEDMVIVLSDVQDQSFLTALRLEDGTEIWRTNRDEPPTWGSPAVDLREGRAQVVVNGYEHIGGYDLYTGEELWRLHGGGDVPVPTPIVAHDLIYITNAHGRQAPIYAIHPMVEGEITDDPDAGHMAWRTLKYGNYMQTPLVYGDLLYACRDNGILSCYDARSGELKYRERIGNGQSGFSASCVACGGKIYITGEEGEIHVLEAGDSFNIVATNHMNETCMATPAIVDGVIYFRTRGHVIAVAHQ